MASFNRSIDHVDLEQEEEQKKEYLEIFSKNFKDEVITLTDCYTESVANFFRFPGTVGMMPNHTNESKEVEVKDEIDKALDALLLSALKLSQALNEKYIKMKQKK